MRRIMLLTFLVACEAQDDQAQIATVPAVCTTFARRCAGKTLEHCDGKGWVPVACEHGHECAPVCTAYQGLAGAPCCQPLVIECSPWGAQKCGTEPREVLWCDDAQSPVLKWRPLHPCPAKYTCEPLAPGLAHCKGP